MYLPVAFAIYASDEHYWGLYAVSVSFALAIFRKLVIAGKYACFPQEKYEELLLPGTNIFKDLLLVSWYVELSQEFLMLLVEEAEKAARVSLDGQFFTLADGVTKVSAKAYLRRVVQHSFKVAPALWPRLVLLATLGLSFLPLWLFIDVETNKRSVKAILLLVFTIVQAFFYGRAVFGFLLAGVLHYWRFMRMHFFHGKALGLAGTNNESRTCSTIPASIPINIVVWTSVRTVIRNFSRTHTTRISFNFFAILVISGLFVLILLQQLLSKQRQYQLIAVLAYLFVCFTIGLVTAILLAVRTNQSGPRMLKLLYDEHFAFLWRRMHQADGDGLSGAGSYGLVRYKGSSAAVHSLSKEAEWKETFDVVKETLQQGNDIEPLIIMFVPASPELLSFVLSIFISGMTLMLGVVSSNIPGLGGG
jgi:hypothetical protein